MAIKTPTTAKEFKEILLSVEDTAFLNDYSLLNELGFTNSEDSSAFYVAKIDNLYIEIFILELLIIIKSFYSVFDIVTQIKHREHDLPAEIIYNSTCGSIALMSWYIDGGLRRIDSEKDKELSISIMNSGNKIIDYYDGLDTGERLTLMNINFVNEKISDVKYIYKDYDFTLDKLKIILPDINYPELNTVDDYYFLDEMLKLSETQKALLEIILFTEV